MKSIKYYKLNVGQNIHPNDELVRLEDVKKALKHQAKDILLDFCKNGTVEDGYFLIINQKAFNKIKKKYGITKKPRVNE